MVRLFNKLFCGTCFICMFAHRGVHSEVIGDEPNVSCKATGEVCLAQSVGPMGGVVEGVGGDRVANADGFAAT